jgi:hypothetical protein
MNVEACNYNFAATDDDGSCLFAVGCDYCSGGALVDGDADNDGVCDENEISGCTDPSACNFNVTATQNDILCVYPSNICEECSGATDGSGVVVNLDPDADWVCQENYVFGCPNPGACNFNVAVTSPCSGCCIYPSDDCEVCSGAADGSGVVVDLDPDGDGVCNEDE